MLGSEHLADSYPMAIIARGIEEEGASSRYVVIGNIGNMSFSKKWKRFHFSQKGGVQRVDSGIGRI